MKPTTWFSCSALLLGLAACGDVDHPAASGTGGAGAGATTGSPGPPGSSGDSTGSGAAPGKAVTLEMTPFDVQPGAEVYKCPNLANPFGGESEARQFASHMTPGSHHLLLFYTEGGGDGALEDCSGLEFAPTPFSTQLPDDTVSYPDGVAALVTSDTGLRM